MPHPHRLSAAGRKVRVGDRVVVESPVYRPERDYERLNEWRFGAASDSFVGAEGTVEEIDDDRDAVVDFGRAGTWCIAPAGLLHVADLPALAAERAPAPRFKVGDRVVIESNLLPDGTEGWLGAEIIGIEGEVALVGTSSLFDDGGPAVEAAGYELHPDAFLLVSDLPALAASRAPRYEVGDRVEVVDREFLLRGTPTAHYGRSAPQIGDVVEVETIITRDDISEGNICLGGYLFDPAAVRPAPPAVPLADWERELYLGGTWTDETAPARPKPGDFVELVDPGVAPWKTHGGRFRPGAAYVRAWEDAPGEVIDLDPWHPDNVVVRTASGSRLRVLASAVRVVPAPVVEPACGMCEALFGSYNARLHTTAAAPVVEEAPTPAPEPKWTHKDTHGDKITVSLEGNSEAPVEVVFSGTSAVVRDDIEGDEGIMNLTPRGARILAASLVAAADAASPAPVAEGYSIPQRFIVGVPAPTFGLAEGWPSVSELLARSYR